MTHALTRHMAVGEATFEETQHGLAFLKVMNSLVALVMPSEQRRFYRCSLTCDSAATLVVRSRRLPCVLRDRSIGGFGVELSYDPIIAEIGQGTLETIEGSFPVQIVHTSLSPGGLLLGLAEVGPAQTRPAISSRQLRGLSFALGTAAAVFLTATVALTLHADDVVRWLEDRQIVPIGWQPPFVARNGGDGTLLR